MSEVELDHVQIAAPEGCEEAARAFFGGLLGLTEIEKPERLRARGGAWFAVGDRQLHSGSRRSSSRPGKPMWRCGWERRSSRGSQRG